MSRLLTDPDNDGVLEWTERVIDEDGDSLSISVELDAIDDGSGWTQQDTDSSNVSWLSYTTTTNTLSNGETEVVVTINADESGLTKDYKYRITVFADDGTTNVGRDVILYAEDTGTSYQAWDTSQLTFITQEDITGNNNGVYLREGGSELYIANEVGNVSKFSLSTNYDPATRSSVNNISPVSTARGLFLSSDGTKMFIRTTGKIIEYILSTPWDISTFTKENEIAANDGYGMTYGLNGFRIYYNRIGSIYQLSLSEPFSLGSRFSTDVASGFEDEGVEISPNGKTVVTVDEYSSEWKEYELGTAWDITSGISNVYTGGKGSYGSLTLSRDGTHMYMTGDYDALDYLKA